MWNILPLKHPIYRAHFHTSHISCASRSEHFVGKFRQSISFLRTAGLAATVLVWSQGAISFTSPSPDPTTLLASDDTTLLASGDTASHPAASLMSQKKSQEEHQENTSPIAGHYPRKPITLVSPYGKGGAADIAARILASVTPQYLGQAVQVENRLGNGSITGSDGVFNDPGQGDTLLLARFGTMNGGAAVRNDIPYDFTRFTMLGMLEINPWVCATGLNSGITSIKQLVQTVRQAPEQVSFSMTGAGDLHHLIPMFLLDRMGIPDPTRVRPAFYPSGKKNFQAGATGEVTFVCGNLSAANPFIRSGQLRPLLVNTPQRHSQLPGVPVVSELGLSELEHIAAWSALFAPPDIPHAVREKWRNVLRQVRNDPAWNKLVTATGSIPGILTPEKTRAFILNQSQQINELVTRLKLKQ